MVKCCYPRCSNASYNKSPDITFHRFPKDENLRNIWVKFINKTDWQPNSSSVLCSKHFESHLICRKIQRTVLLPNAVPTLNNCEEAELSQENKENTLLPLEQHVIRKRTAMGELVVHDTKKVPADIQPGPSGISPTSTLTVPSGSRSHVKAITLPPPEQHITRIRTAMGKLVVPDTKNVPAAIQPGPSGIPPTSTLTVPSGSRSHVKAITLHPPEQHVTRIRTAMKELVVHDTKNVPAAIQPGPSGIPPTSTLTVPSESRSHVKAITLPPPEQHVTRIRTAIGELVMPDTKNVPAAIQPCPSGIPPTSTLTVPSGSRSHYSRALAQTSSVTKLQKRIIVKNRKIKSLQERSRRMKKKVENLCDIIAELKKKLNEEQMSIMSSIPVNNKDIMARYIKKAQGSTLEKSYPPEIRSFALQLNFYSARAYNYVRKSFNTVLPHPATLSRWYKKVDAQPGFTEESFKTLKSLAENTKHEIFVNLSIDEMAIKKEQVWDSTNSTYRGHVDTGTEVSDDSLPLATQALVLMVTAINAGFKIPIAYLFIASMTGEQRANIVQMAIEMLYKINIFVRGITFDGAFSNISMATVLGCNFDLENFAPYFYYKDLKIYAFYDPCHMIKLIRNCLGTFKVLVDKNGYQIDFKYLTLLHNLTEEKGVHLGIKIRKAHIYFAKQKMKVRLAAQLFSKSVADALLFCKDVLHLKEFEGCAATIHFINIINDSFDILNSRTTLAPGNKKALCESNIERVTEFVETTSDYLLNLKFTSGQKVVNSARKTGFVGFIICLYNVLNLFNDLYVKGGIKFLCTYKISQDHLEMFFGKMRARGGFNDNPNVVQFQTAYKKNLIVTELQLREKGILNLDNSILNVSSTKCISNINSNTPSYDKTDITLTPVIEENVYLFLNNILTLPLDAYTAHVATYIAGFISRRILQNIKCLVCQQTLMGDKADFLLSLINIKDRGGLTYPSMGLVKIVKKCETFLRWKTEGNTYSQFIYYFINDFSNIEILKNECPDIEHDYQHLYMLLKIIVKLYFNIRCKHAAKSNDVSERNYMKKLIHNKNK